MRKTGPRITTSQKRTLRLSVSTWRLFVSASCLLVVAAAFIFSPAGAVRTMTPDIQAELNDVKISEFRLRGPNGASNEFIELYNNTDSQITVTDASSMPTATPGWAVVSSDAPALIKCLIPAGQTIPARGHFLCANSVGYSLGGLATANATYVTGIPADTGIALFRSTNSANFTNADRLDAVGPTSEANVLFKEGTGLPVIGNTGNEHSWVRRLPGGCTGSLPGYLNHNCVDATSISVTPGPVSAIPQDTGDNASDFIIVDTQATVVSANNRRLGAPGPENLTSPVAGAETGIGVSLIDPCKGERTFPNRFRDLTPVTNGPNGTLFVRRKFTNNTGQNLTRLRFRIMDLSTFPVPVSGEIADLRVLSSINTTVSISAACGGGTISALGTTLENVSPAQPIGGGFNSTLVAGTITPATPLAPGASISVQFVFGVQLQVGTARFYVVMEGLPRGGGVFGVRGGGADLGPPATAMPVIDFDGDDKSDVSVFRPSNGFWYLLQSQAGFTGLPFGQSGDKITPADFDGDGKTDLAVFRNGTWYLQRSTLGFTSITFGASTDVPMPADFSGDGKSEIAVFRPPNGTWYLFDLVNNQVSSFAFGTSGDIPVAADYDGDMRADVAVFRPSNGTWYLQRSTAGFTAVPFGQMGDKPVVGDYDGDGMADIAVFRPSSGVWYLLRSSLGFTGVSFGLGTDTPTPADYDGDGKTDVAVFRPSNGTWYLNRSTSGFTAVPFGQSTDIPVPAAYIP